MFWGPILCCFVLTSFLLFVFKGLLQTSPFELRTSSSFFVRISVRFCCPRFSPCLLHDIDLLSVGGTVMSGTSRAAPGSSSNCLLSSRSKQSAWSGVNPRKCSVAHRYAHPPNRTPATSGPRYRPRIAVSARLPRLCLQKKQRVPSSNVFVGLERVAAALLIASEAACSSKVSR